jgi:hypothetical protein
LTGFIATLYGQWLPKVIQNNEGPTPAVPGQLFNILRIFVVIFGSLISTGYAADRATQQHQRFQDYPAGVFQLPGGLFGGGVAYRKCP